MIVNYQKLIKFCLALSFILISTLSQAATLGRLTAISGLGEPLIAEIELHDINQDELPSYSAKLAKEDAYILQGIKKTPIQSEIKVDVIKKYNGSSVIKLYSAQPIRDQATSLLIQLDWPKGRLVKEYLLTLDNLNNSGAPQVAAPATQTSSKSAELASTEKSESKKPEQTPSTKNGSTAATKDYQTTKGEMLGKIAEKIGHDGMSLEQMARAIYETNKDAFVGGDMNRLKAGAILKIPEKNEASINADYRASLVVKSDDWESYKHKVANVVPDSSAETTQTKQTAQSKIKTNVKDSSEMATDQPRDVLRLSKSERISDENLSKIAQLTEEKRLLQEDAIVNAKRLDEADGRIGQLQKQVEDLQKLLSISNKKLSELESKKYSFSLVPLYAALKEFLNQPSDFVMMLVGLLLIAAIFLIVFMLRRSKPPVSLREEPKL